MSNVNKFPFFLMAAVCDNFIDGGCKSNVQHVANTIN